VRRFHGTTQRWHGLLVLVFVFGLSGCGNGNKTQLRAMNGTPEESQIDVSLDSQTLASGVAYGTDSDYGSVSSGSRHLQIYPAGVATAYIDKTITLNSGGKYTVVSANVLSSATALLLSDEETKPSSATAELRIVNASPSLGTVDVYIVSPGTDLSTVSPTISGFAFEAVSTYRSLTAKTAYEIYVTAANEKTAEIDSGPVTYSGGEARTMIALDGAAGGYTLATLSDLD
jgi:Domain of unknown function (DUF4397)